MSFNKKIIIGARGSRLSLAYANYAKKLIIRNNQLNENEIDIKIIKTLCMRKREKILILNLLN